MDASARRSSSRIPSFVALTVLACISFFAFTSVTSKNRSFIRHERRSIEITGDNAPPLSPNISNSTVSSVGPSPGIISNSAVLSSSSSSLLSSSSSTTTSLLPSSSTTRLTTSSRTSFVPLVTSTPQSQSSSSKPSVVLTPSSSQSAQSSSRTTISPLQLITKVSTSSLTTSVDPLNGIPSTTFLGNFSPTVSTSVEVPASPTISIQGSAVANLSTSFWQKKGAVAAVFVIVSLVIVAVIAVLVFFFLKRRSVRRRELMNDDMFEQFSEQDHRSSSPGPSIGGTPMDPFASTEMVYDTSRTQPIHSYIPPSQTQHHLLSVPSYPVQHPDYYGNQPTSQQLTQSRLDRTPRQLVGTSSPALRTPGARGSYQQSLDSFYGVAGQ